MILYPYYAILFGSFAGMILFVRESEDSELSNKRLIPLIRRLDVDDGQASAGEWHSNSCIFLGIIKGRH